MSDKCTNWPNLGGIYSIRCVGSDSDRVYIGVTRRSFKERWRNHRYEMRSGKHGNSILQNSYNKYGEGAFLFEIVERVDDGDTKFLSERENYWIKKLNSRVENGGCNLQHGDGVPRYSEEARKSQSRAAVKRRGIKYKFKSPNGNIINVDHLINFCKEHGLGPVGMRWVFRGKILSYKGYTAYDSDFVPMCLREYVFLDPNGAELKTNNLKLFAEQNGLSRAGLSSVVNGTYKSHHGWTLKHAKTSKRRDRGVSRAHRPRKCDFIDPEGNIIHVSDLTLFCEENGLSRYRMACVLSNPKTHHKGFRSVSSVLKPPCLRKIIVIGPDGKEHITNNISKFEREHGISPTTLGSVYRGTTKQTANGWKIKQ